MILRRIASVFRADGMRGLLRAVGRRLRTPHARCLKQCRARVSGATGLEIGGPSPIFARGGLLTLYPIAGRIDNVTFAQSTIWADATKGGEAYRFHPGKAPGRQIVAEGAHMPLLPDASYDFVLSSHMLEHTANPLRALGEWRRLLKPAGALVLGLPHRDGTFDHRRPVTTLAHLVEDYARNTSEDDVTHLSEILEMHDLARDPGAGDAATFRERVRRNPELRSAHHHVFDTRLAVEVVGQAGFDVVAVEALEPYHIVVLALKREAKAIPTSSGELLNEALRRSPFATDRRPS